MRLDKEKFYSILRKIPKAEIHLHSEALINREMVSKILARKDPKYNDIHKVNELFQYNSLKGFIRTFLSIQSAFKSISDFKELFSNISPYLKRNGIVYSEIFFAPSNFIKDGIKFHDIMNIFIKEIEKIRRNDGIIVKIIVDVSRTFGVDNAKKNLDYTLKYRNKNIIGIGLGGDEKKGKARFFHSVFEEAGKQGFHLVAHAGEDMGSKSIWDAINFLRVERIGHGISSIKDKKLMDYLIDKQIPLEICPTSNVFTRKYVRKIKDHPIKTFFEKGVFVTLNTDDPSFFNIELIDEYWNLYAELDFSMDDIKQIIINGFRASFITETDKSYYIKRVNSAWKRYAAN